MPHARPRIQEKDDADDDDDAADNDDEYIDKDDFPTLRSRKSTEAGSPLSLLILEGSSRLR